MDLDSMLRLHL